MRKVTEKEVKWAIELAVTIVASSATTGWPDGQLYVGSQADDKYNNYIEWRDLTQKEIMVKLKKEYPESYKKLTETG